MFDNNNTHCIIRTNVQVVLRIASLVVMLALEMALKFWTWTKLNNLFSQNPGCRTRLACTDNDFLSVKDIPTSVFMHSKQLLSNSNFKYFTLSLQFSAVINHFGNQEYFHVDKTRVTIITRPLLKYSAKLVNFKILCRFIFQFGPEESVT
jgi:hypothetical protein